MAGVDGARRGGRVRRAGLLVAVLAALAPLPRAQDEIRPQEDVAGGAAEEPARVARRGGFEPAPLRPEGEASDSPWYLERGTWRRLPRPGDDLDEIAVAIELGRLTRDGRLPGFYDGQFTSTADRFDELARLASDPDVDPTMRMLAVMALQEAGSGEAVAAVLEPLLIPAKTEFDIERQVVLELGAPQEDEAWTRQVLRADLSSYARFALAKDGQPERVLEKIAIMEEVVRKHSFEILSPFVSSRRNRTIDALRWTWFQIGYHYQQFDDFENAARWYEPLCAKLPPNDRWTGAPHYNLACIAALSGRPEEAVAHLRAAHDAGYLLPAWMEEDGDLDSLRDRDDYKALLAEMLGAEIDAEDGSP